jgi:hypothetical protein
MAKLTKAQISYFTQTHLPFPSVLRFHSVIAEDHSISTEITKFPVQSGFQVSNHAIRKNRLVSITGVISNHLVVGSEEFHEYGGNNCKIMFETLETLVRTAIYCDVVTNYGNYTDVVFTDFKTKLVAGKTDIMEFTLSGEEVQVATTLAGHTPDLLAFSTMRGSSKRSRIAELTNAGFDVPEGATISECNVDLSTSFQTEVSGTNGRPIIITYENIGYDETTKQHSYLVSTSDTDVVQVEEEDGINWFSLLRNNADLTEGAITASACLKDGLIGLGSEIVDDTINTALGKLKKNVYGAAYGTFGVNGDRSFGQILLALGVDCIVAGAIGTVDPSLNEEDFRSNDLPTVDSILEGAARTGDIASTTGLRANAPVTLTKISNTGSVNYLERYLL